jgi:hypothetical protein
MNDPDCSNEYLQSIVGDMIDGVEKAKCNISHEFAPFVLSLLRNADRLGDVSGPSLSTLKANARNAAIITISRDHAMDSLGEHFSKTGIHAVFLKGAAMNSSFYPHDAFRRGSDVDLLVTEEDFGQLESALSDLATNRVKYPGKPAFNAFSIEKSFIMKEPFEVQLDMHCQIASRGLYKIDYKELFERTVTVQDFQSQFVRLSNEDSLLHFAMHSFYDLQLVSKQTVDAYVMLQKGSMDWQALMIRARQYRAIMPLKYFLEGLRLVFGFEPPGQIKDELAISGIRKKLVYHLMQSSPSEGKFRRVKYRVRQLLTQFLLSGNIIGYLRYYFNYSGAKLTDVIGQG